MKCQRKGCDEPGRFKPTIYIYPAGHPDYDGPPAQMMIDIIVCLVHSKDEDESKKLFEISLPLIQDTCAALGKAQPDQERSKLEWVAVQ